MYIANLIPLQKQKMPPFHFSVHFEILPHMLLWGSSKILKLSPTHTPVRFSLTTMHFIFKCMPLKHIWFYLFEMSFPNCNNNSEIWRIHSIHDISSFYLKRIHYTYRLHKWQNKRNKPSFGFHFTPFHTIQNQEKSRDKYCNSYYSPCNKSTPIW